MKLRLIEQTSTVRFMEEIEDAIKDGFKPQGGMATESGLAYTAYLLLMVKDPPVTTGYIKTASEKPLEEK